MDIVSYDDKQIKNYSVLFYHVHVINKQKIIFDVSVLFAWQPTFHSNEVWGLMPIVSKNLHTK